MKKTRNIKKFIVTITLILLILILGYLCKLALLHTSFYKYDTHSDYQYNFQFSRKDNLEIEDHSIKSLPWIHGATSAFLSVKIKSTLLSRIFPPCITILSESIQDKQCFEFGASGVRYLNLSSFIGQSNLQFEVNNLTLDNQKVQLAQDIIGDYTTKNILILAPHPDDAEIAAYGLYSKAKNAYVITVTAGDAGGELYSDLFAEHELAEIYKAKGELRTWNSITTPMLAGVKPQNMLNLGYYDGTLKIMHKEPNEVVHSLHNKEILMSNYRKFNNSELLTKGEATATWANLISDLQIVLDKTQPDLIVSPYPAIDAHADHKFTTVALIEALSKSTTAVKPKLLLYTAHLPNAPSETYPFGAKGDGVTLPPLGKQLFFRKIISIPLDANLQRKKYIALDSMSDLRPSARRQKTSKLISLNLNQLLNETTGSDSSYFRRAVRSNELFFEINTEDALSEVTRKKIYGDLD
ncbi:PIG-L family deacetylase [Chitinibacter fontanus]|uniref:PIG-L family deacetylase n=1 Tax=Chitinibacter fontanus TaxID=1737446 RepID=A0A7D5VAX9_9NEIS|nr:PIG-L family deacetylase [Chitinibacter fontanus]QLI82559.1 PIG-L family deacetylase [Chitinibacter fontanus]